MRSGEETLVNGTESQAKWSSINSDLIHCDKRGDTLMVNGGNHHHLNSMKPILNGKTKIPSFDPGIVNNHTVNDGKISLRSHLNAKQRVKKVNCTNGPTAIGRDGDLVSVNGINQGNSENTITILISNSSASSFSSSHGLGSCNDASKESSSNTISRASPKRRKISSCSISVKKRISSKKKAKSELTEHHTRNFHQPILPSCDEDDSFSSDYTVLPLLTLSHKVVAQTSKMSDLRNQLISHKFLLTNLIKVKQSGLNSLVRATKNYIKRERLVEEPGRTHLDSFLKSQSNRVSSKCPEDVLSIRRGICCYENDDTKCYNPSLPFSRHCRKHILYNVNQLLFVRCTAKDNDTLTQCTCPSLDILKGDPLCTHHWHLSNRKMSTANDEVDEQFVISRGKARSGSRLGRRTKKRKRVGSKPGSSSIDSIDSSSFLSQDSSDNGPFINSENCDSTQVQLSTSAIKFPPNNRNILSSSSLQVEDQVTSSSLLSSSHTSNNHSDLPSDRTLFNHLPIVTVTSASLTAREVNSFSTDSIPHPTVAPPPVVPNSPKNHLLQAIPDVAVSSIVPGDEALVASLVAELPPLGQETVPESVPVTFADADLNEVLNKIPDDAFNEFFGDNLKGVDIPSKEESEALEQALATVSQNVHFLSVAASVAGNSDVTAVSRPITTNALGNGLNGETNFYTQSLNSQPEIHVRQNPTPSLNLNENDILGLANNILTSLTTEQHQTLNNLIDGALASGTLTSSPTIKSALASLSSISNLPAEEQLGAHL